MIEKYSQLIKKVFNIKNDYVEVIPGGVNPEENEETINNFFEKVKNNRGKIKNLQVANVTNTFNQYTEEFDGEYAKKHPYATGFIEKNRAYEINSNQTIIHYKCYKKLEHEKSIKLDKMLDGLGKINLKG